MSEQDESDDSMAFIRQRRNIILASLVLAFAQRTHLTIEHVNFFGASAHIDSPVSTVPYLWVLWLYFLWRYWQAFRVVERDGTINRYKKVKKQFVERASVARALQPYQDKNPSLVPTDSAKAIAWMPADEETPTAQGATVTVVTNIQRKPDGGQTKIDIQLNRTQLRKAKAKAILQLSFTSNELTEYYLPFLIAAIPIVILIFQVLRG